MDASTSWTVAMGIPRLSWAVMMGMVDYKGGKVVKIGSMLTKARWCLKTYDEANRKGTTTRM